MQYIATLVNIANAVYCMCDDLTRLKKPFSPMSNMCLPLIQRLSWHRNVFQKRGVQTVYADENVWLTRKMLTLLDLMMQKHTIQFL